MSVCVRTSGTNRLFQNRFAGLQVVAAADHLQGAGGHSVDQYGFAGFELSNHAGDIGADGQSRQRWRMTAHTPLDYRFSESLNLERFSASHRGTIMGNSLSPMRKKEIEARSAFVPCCRTG